MFGVQGSLKTLLHKIAHDLNGLDDLNDLGDLGDLNDRMESDGIESDQFTIGSMLKGFPLDTGICGSMGTSGLRGRF